ncbi:MAG TPA: response regulator transcription factor [Puia sp.]|nr:response regulator transcription factor [Puia sp.]
MRPIQIMIVEDHQLVRQIWTQMLGEEPGFTVVASTASGAEALSLAPALKPDILLTDIAMSPVSGIELTRRIRKSCPAIKVIGLSMHIHPSYARQMMQAGAKGYASKNSSRGEMVDAIVKVNAGGSYLSSEVRAALLAEGFSDDPEPHLRILSDREMEITIMVRDGCSSKEIAVKLDLSPRTVETHRHNILKKLKLKNSAALVQWVTSING